MTYQAPLADMGFALTYGAGLPKALESGLFGDLGMDDIEAVIGEAGRIAADMIAPLNRVGDQHGIKLDNGAVVTAPGFKDAYRSWREGGWNAACRRRKRSAARDCRSPSTPPAPKCGARATMAFGAVPAADHGRDRGARRPRQRRAEAASICKSWSPANGPAPCISPSRRPARTSARCAPAPSAPATAATASPGTKIFITYGDHDMTDNIVHFVLARLPDAPRRHARAFRCSWCRNSWSTPTARSARATTSAPRSHRAQARHPRLADLHHDPSATTAAPSAI